MNINKLRDLIQSRKYRMSDHVLKQLTERQIPREHIIKTALNGEIIEDYPNDYPFPSCLTLAWVENRPIHVVVAMDCKENIAYFITVYEPSLEKFESDFKTRRK